MSGICHEWNQTGTCRIGTRCKYCHVGNPGGGNAVARDRVKQGAEEDDSTRPGRVAGILVVAAAVAIITINKPVAEATEDEAFVVVVGARVDMANRTKSSTLRTRI